MLQHAQQFKAAGIPFVFDPGQGLPMFDGKRTRGLHRSCDLGHGERLRRQDARASAPAGAAPRSRSASKGLVVTLGGEGCEVWVGGEKTLVPPREGRAKSSTPRAAAMPGAARCSTGWSRAGTLARCAAAGQPGRRDQDRQPRAAELHAGVRLTTRIEPRAIVTPPSTTIVSPTT